ncbi:hypothetical protein Tco_1031064 [Tanacetum coccineum]|uniref:Uncharacterized protein n=1 Tax=Tanacetum coccineum TaxID=301880 RepID=A0ABQ5G928_9ASTR
MLEERSHVAKAIEKYEKTRADSNNIGGSGSTNTGGTVVPEMHGCSYKTFMNCKPHSFKGTEGVVGLKRRRLPGGTELFRLWTRLMLISLEQRDSYDATEYCPATEIEKIGQELGLTMKGD